MRMKILYLLALQLVVLHQFQCLQSIPHLLSSVHKDYFPLQYEMKYNFTLPYWKQLQKDGLTYQVHVWVDEELDASRMDTLGGVDSTIQVGSLVVSLTPRIDEEICIKVEDGPKLTSGLHDSGVLPNLNQWKYQGHTEVNGKDVVLYTHIQRNFQRVAHYEFYLTEQGDPVRFYMKGQDYFSGSHFDEYIADFEFYKPGPVDQNVFRIPDICKNSAQTYSSKDFEGFEFQFSKFMPFPVQGDPEYDQYSKDHNRQHRSHAEYHTRRHLYLQNKKFVEEHNNQNSIEGGAATKVHQLELNQFADWSHKEFKSSKLGRLPHLKEKLEVAKRNNNTKDHSIAYVPLVDSKKLPKSFSWQGTPNDGHVKDQAVCGSCWSFGATGAMEAAWYNKTGKQVSLSEQQLADCSWNYQNNACNGGLSEQAINYVVDMGGLSQEGSYEYEGNDNFCRKERIKPAAVYKGYTVVPSQEDKVKEAIYSRGPMQIAIDAAQNSFRFYKSGVYYDKKCKMDAMDLDHSIMLVGYGTTDDGEDYWVVKNTWSTYWGDKGYMKISRKHDCGIKQDAIYAHVDLERAQELSLI